MPAFTLQMRASRGRSTAARAAAAAIATTTKTTTAATAATAASSTTTTTSNYSDYGRSYTTYGACIVLVAPLARSKRHSIALQWHVVMLLIEQ